MQHPLHASGYRPPFDSPLHRLDPRAKLIAVASLVVVAVSTPPEAYAVLTAYAVLLAVGLTVGRLPPGYVLARWLIVLPFIVAVMAVPFLGPGDWRIWGVWVSKAGLIVLWNVTIKASLAVLTMTLLIGSTHFADVLEAMDRLRMPRVLVMLIGVTHRYLSVLAEEAGRMKRAGDARGYGGRWIWQAGVVGRMVGTLFLRSYERGERVQAAMLARGLDGMSTVGSHPMRFGAIDWLVLTGWLAALAILRVAAIWTNP